MSFKYFVAAEEEDSDRDAEDVLPEQTATSSRNGKMHNILYPGKEKSVH